MGPQFRAPIGVNVIEVIGSPGGRNPSQNVKINLYLFTEFGGTALNALQFRALKVVGLHTIVIRSS